MSLKLRIVEFCRKMSSTWGFLNLTKQIGNKLLNDICLDCLTYKESIPLVRRGTIRKDMAEHTQS